MRIKFDTKGELENTMKLLNKYGKLDATTALKAIGDTTIEELAAVSPVRTGEYKASWGYTISNEKGKQVLGIINPSHPEVSDLSTKLEYGHVTQNGKFVDGHHFIKPTMDKVYSEIKDDLFGEVLDVE